MQIIRGGAAESYLTGSTLHATLSAVATKTRKQTPPSPPAPVDVQKRVSELVGRIGIVKAAHALGIGREAVTRIVAGLGVRAGTVAQVEQTLKENGS